MSMDEARRKVIRQEIRVLEKPGGPRVGPQGGLPDSELIWIERCRDLLLDWDAAETRNQELDTHISRLRKALEKIRGFAWQQLGGHGPKYPPADPPPEELLEVIKNALSSTPADSLERLRLLEKMYVAFRDSDPRGLEDSLDALDAEVMKEGGR